MYTESDGCAGIGPITEINNSIKNEYHTQINNKVIPIDACPTTSMIMFLKYLGIEFYCPDGVQPEDHLSRMLLTPEAYALMEERYIWTRGKGYRPQEIHGMLEWAAERLVGRKVSSFCDDMSEREIVYRLARRECLVISGKFSELNHVVCLVGLQTRQPDILQTECMDDVDMQRVTGFIIDDPYGNYHTNYRDHAGNDIQMPYQDFRRMIKKQGEPFKWAHYRAL